MPALRLLISGKVQGVFFRASAKEKADSLGLVGTAKNTAGGRVEIRVAGDPYALRIFTDWCRLGPPTARVDEVLEYPEAEITFADFRIIR